MSEIRNKVIDDLARIIHRQKFPPNLWDEIVIKEPWLELAREYFKKHPELAVVDRKAELPDVNSELNPIARSDEQRRMLKAGYVMEVKE